MPEMQGVGRPRNASVLSYSPSYGMFLWKAGCSETGLSSLGRGQRRRAAKYLAGALLHLDGGKSASSYLSVQDRGEKSLHLLLRFRREEKPTRRRSKEKQFHLNRKKSYFSLTREVDVWFPLRAGRSSLRFCHFTWHIHKERCVGCIVCCTTPSSCSLS